MIETVYIHPLSVDTILELVDAMDIDSCSCVPCENWKSIRAKLIASKEPPSDKKEFAAWLEMILADQQYRTRFSPKVVKLWGWDPTPEELVEWTAFLDSQSNLERIEEMECLECGASNKDDEEFCVVCEGSMVCHDIWLVYRLKV